MVDKQAHRLQGLVITFKTIFLLYVFLFFLIAYENVVVIDRVWGTIYSIAVLFAIPYLILDYIIAILRYYNVIKDGKFGGIFILDLMIDHAPKFPTKDGFVADWKGFALQGLIGILLFAYFWNLTTTTGEIFAGTPTFTAPAQLTPQDIATRSGLVAIPENTLSTTITSAIALVLFYLGSRFKIIKGKSLLAVFLVLLVGSYASSLYMADLHLSVYPLDETARVSIQKFFFVINTVTAVTGAQYSADILHFQWNKNIVTSGLCIGCS